MISVVIPLYNKAQFVAEAVHSVLDQRFADFELLVVNDGSTDGSKAIVEAIEDERLQLIDIVHSGVSVARNTGIRASKFDWIAFLDADDWWDENFLAEMVTCIKNYPEQKLFASGRTHVFRDFTKRYSNRFIPKEGTVGLVNFFEVIRKYLPLINSSNAVILKAHFETAGYFREKQRKHEDHDLWMRMSIGQQVVFLNKNLSFYRNTEDHSASTMDYDPLDFCMFLQTLQSIKPRLTDLESVYFRKYCNRFVLLTYIKNYSKYSKVEDEIVYADAKKVLSGIHLILLRILKQIPYKKTYRFFKYFQG